MTDLQDPPAVDMSPVLRCYVLLGVGVVLSLLPEPFMSSVGLIACMIGTIWAYLIRRVPPAGGLLHSHGRWMVRSFWISSAYITLAMILSAAIISGNADGSAIDNMAAGVSAGSVRPDEVSGLLDQYFETNSVLIAVSTFVCFGPIVAFALLRFFIGYRHAYAGRGLPNVTTWWVR